MQAIVRRVATVLLVALAISLASASFSTAGTGGSLRLPAPGAKFYHGLDLAVDCEWVSGYGYRPVRLELTRPSVANTERRVRIEVGLCQWGDRKYTAATTELVIPAGEQSAQTVLAIPQQVVTQAITVRCREKGELLEELSINEPVNSPLNNWGGENTPRILFVSDASPDVSAFSFLLMPPYFDYGNTTQISRTADSFSFIHLAPDKLFERWIHYSALDLVFITLNDARDLAAQRPAAWQALLQWNRTGGSLCVSGAESDWAKLAEIEQLCQCPADEAEAVLDARGWTQASPKFFENEVVPLIHRGPGIPLQQWPPPTPKDIPFVWKSSGFGRVVAIARPDPFPGDAAHWQWLVESLGESATRWTVRNGTVPFADNEQFNEFLIADVGLPPIQMYRVLISVFVIAIGPVNYWLLRRAGRLHLFLFTVPLAAVVTSLGLISYALLSDGLGSKIRSRSLTHLDQRHGQAVSRARLSYYVGLAPSDGLVFPRDVIVEPLALTGSDEYWSRTREIVWNDKQRLTRGWLGSRMPTQYVTARAQASQAALQITPSSDGSRRLVKNGLGVTVHDLLLCDESGAWHRGQKLAPQAGAPLELLSDEQSRETARKAFLTRYLRHAPALPADMTTVVGSSSMRIFGFRRSINFGQGGSYLYASALELDLAELQTDIIAGTLPPRCYVAIVDRPPEIVTGLEDASQSQSLHIIHGTW